MTLSLEVLERLVSFETVSDRSNLAMIAYVEDFLRSRGFRCGARRGTKKERPALIADPSGRPAVRARHD